MTKDLIIYGYNNRNLGDDLMFAEIINKTNYDRYYFIGHGMIPHFVKKPLHFIKPGRLMKLRWKHRADFAVIGGSVLMGATPAQLEMIEQKRQWFKWNKLLGGRNFIIGANLGPYRDETSYLSTLLKLDAVVDRWFVRDDFSLQLLRKISARDCRLMPDIVMGLNVKNYRQAQDNSVAISVTVVGKDNNKSIDEEAYNHEIARLAEHYVRQGKTINFLSFEDTVDIAAINKITELVADEFKSSINVLSNEGDNIVYALSQADVVVSTRFHAMVLAALFEKKQIIYSYNNKTSQFAQTHGFTTYPVDGEFLNKPPLATRFDLESLSFVKSYAGLVES